jgi:hypothetical protein
MEWSQNFQKIKQKKNHKYQNGLLCSSGDLLNKMSQNKPGSSIQERTGARN